MAVPSPLGDVKIVSPISTLRDSVPIMCARERHLFFSSKDNRTVKLTRQDFLPDRTADRDLLFIFSSNILDFRRSLSSCIKIWLAVRRLIAIFSLAGPPRDPKKNVFSNLKLVSEVSHFKSSNMCLICSRSSLKRLKDINKNAISTLSHQFFKTCTPVCLILSAIGRFI